MALAKKLTILTFGVLWLHGCGSQLSLGKKSGGDLSKDTLKDLGQDPITTKVDEIIPDESIPLPEPVIPTLDPREIADGLLNARRSYQSLEVITVKISGEAIAGGREMEIINESNQAVLV